MGYFFVKTHIISGPGTLNKLQDVICEMKCSRPMIVTDGGLAKSGQLDRLVKILKNVEKLEIFNDVRENPDVALMDLLADKIKEKNCDLAIGFGGGSSLDAAKGAAIVATNGVSARDCISREKFETPPLPVIAIPTTAGTGSEVTWHISVVDEVRHLKLRIRSPQALPFAAILDSELLTTLPKKLAAACGIDAFTHAYESYISTAGAWELTDCLSLEAVKLIAQNLKSFVDDRNNIEAGQKMLFASMLAGMVVSHARTGIVHAMSKPLGAQFNIHHGLANAILLPYVASFSRDSNPDKYVNLAKAMGENVEGLEPNESAERFVERIQKLCDDVGIPKGLHEFIKDNRCLSDLAKDAMEGREFHTNPMKIFEKDVLELYRKAYEGR